MLVLSPFRPKRAKCRIVAAGTHLRDSLIDRYDSRDRCSSSELVHTSRGVSSSTRNKSGATWTVIAGRSQDWKSASSHKPLNYVTTLLLNRDKTASPKWNNADQSCIQTKSWCIGVTEEEKRTASKLEQRSRREREKTKKLRQMGHPVIIQHFLSSQLLFLFWRTAVKSRDSKTAKNHTPSTYFFLGLSGFRYCRWCLTLKQKPRRRRLSLV